MSHRYPMKQWLLHEAGQRRMSVVYGPCREIRWLHKWETGAEDFGRDAINLLALTRRRIIQFLASIKVWADQMAVVHVVVDPEIAPIENAPGWFRARGKLAVFVKEVKND